MAVVVLPMFADSLANTPAVFWLCQLPYNILIKGVLVALRVVRGKIATRVLLFGLNLLFLVPCRPNGWIGGMIASRFGYPG